MWKSQSLFVKNSTWEIFFKFSIFWRIIADPVGLRNCFSYKCLRKNASLKILLLTILRLLPFILWTYFCMSRKSWSFFLQNVCEKTLLWKFVCEMNGWKRKVVIGKSFTIAFLSGPYKGLQFFHVRNYMGLIQKC